MSAPPKLQRMRQRLMKEGAMVGGGLAALLFLFAVIGWYVSDLDTEKRRLQGQVNQYRQQSAMLQAKLVKARESLDLYKAINEKTQGEGFVIERERGKQLLDDLKQEFHIASLAVTMSPVLALDDGPPAPVMPPSGAEGSVSAAKKVSVIASDVTLTVTALTDEEAFSFTNAVKLRFPGYVRMTRFHLDRTERLTATAFAAISRGEMPVLAKGEVQFRWIGFRYNDAEEKDKNNGKDAKGPEGADAKRSKGKGQAL